MIETTNLTNTAYDLERYRDADDVRAFLRTFSLDGLEVMPWGENTLSFLPPDAVPGLHLGYFPCWVDFYRGQEEPVLREFGSMQAAYDRFGGETPEAIVEFFRRQMDFAESLHVKYVVFHVSDVSIRETVSYRFEHTDEEVIDASAEVLNRAMEGRAYSFELLLENLWWPGFTFTRPEMTRRMLDGIGYPRTGIMLDVGHLMHTNLDLTGERDGAAYVLRQMDAHGALASRVRGLHMNFGATGDAVRAMLRAGVPQDGDYWTRLGNAYEWILKIDPHRPFETPAAAALIREIQPAYLTHEFITESRAQHEAFLKTQRTAAHLA